MREEFPDFLGDDGVRGMHAVEDGVEFFDVDITARQHRLVVTRQHFGAEIAVYPGPKAEDPASPTEVLQLTREQAAALCSVVASPQGMMQASAAVAALMRDGCSEPDRVAAAAVAAVVGVAEADVLAAMALARDAQSRGRHGSPEPT